MSETVVVGMLALVGTIIGTFGGILTSNKLTVYRIERLEEKVKEHNNVVERTYAIEGRLDTVEKEVDDLKLYHKPK